MAISVDPTLEKELEEYDIPKEFIEKVDSYEGSDIILKDGYIYNDDGDEGNVHVMGKWSAAAKVILKAYDQLPGPIKAVAGYGAVNAMAKTLAKWSGSLEKGIQVGFEAVGFSPTIAKWLAKGISFALF